MALQSAMRTLRNQDVTMPGQDEGSPWPLFPRPWEDHTNPRSASDTTSPSPTMK
jgi:hypothetical protein